MLEKCECLNEHANKEAARLLEVAQNLTDNKDRAALFQLALLYMERAKAVEPSAAAGRRDDPEPRAYSTAAECGISHEQGGGADTARSRF